MAKQEDSHLRSSVLISLLGLLCAFAVPSLGVVTQADAYPSLVVKFPDGNADVTPAMREQIADFVTKARANHKNGAIDEVHVAAFADAVRPIQRSLPEGQQELAQTRASNLRDYIQKTLKLDVDTSNMAKAPGYVSRALGTENARIKGEAAPGPDRIANAIQRNGETSSAVLVLEVDDG